MAANTEDAYVPPFHAYLQASEAKTANQLITMLNEIELSNDADNSDAIAAANGKVYNVTLSGRTLYKDGKWNTLCLPFDVTIADSPLEGATARPLSEASISGTTLNLTFGDAVSTLVAGTPYIIKWTKADGYDTASEDTRDIKDPVFEGVTIDKTDRSYDNGETNGDTRVRFVGTYKSIVFTNEDKENVLLLGGNNKLHYVTAGAGLGAQRAYFRIGDDAVQAPRLTSFNINFGGEDNATGIMTIGQLDNLQFDNSVYDLQGRKVAKPTKGLYIVNGKKVVIK